MGKIFGIFLIVFAIWVGMTIYSEGMERAFGGLLVRFVPATAEARIGETRAPLERVRDRANAARDRGLDRIDRQLSPSGHEQEDDW